MPTSPRKANIARACAELGLIFVAPDTSPRGTEVPDDEAYDFGQGAGFYVDATQAPLRQPIIACTPTSTEELPALIAANFPADMDRQGDHRPFDGRAWRAHHRAAQSRPVPLGLRLRADRRAGQVPWGEKALGRYLGPDRAAWRAHDAVALIEDGARLDALLVDQGEADNFLAEQLRPELLRSGLRRRPESRSSCGCSRATTTAIISSRPSWRSTCAGTPGGSTDDFGLAQRRDPLRRIAELGEQRVRIVARGAGPVRVAVSE